MPSIRPLSLPFLSLFLCNCAAAPPVRDSGALAAELEQELAERARAANEASGSGDPWDPWAASLELSAPAVIAARHELASVEARARSAGAPPAMLEAESVGSGAERETELLLAFDLPSLTGTGRAAATRARAEVAAARARAGLAAARFGAQHELERALAQLAVARQLEREVAELEQSCAPGATRLELLAGRGWLPPDQVAAASLMLHHLSALGLEQRAAAAAARARVAHVAGLAPSSAWLDDDESTDLSVITGRTRGRAAPPDPSARELLERLPALRLARLDYLAAEAEVRIACAERWPALLIGPKATFAVDDLLGGVLRLELPWPPAANAAVDAARSARDGARAALASALVAAQNDIVERREELRAAELALHTHGEGVARSSAELLQAAQARFSVDTSALPEWTMAIDQRTRALAARSAALGRWLAVTFDLSEALGPAPDASSSSVEGGA
jgi:outer membrane protein TolC